MKNHTFFITCSFGIESICKKELQLFNIEKINLNNGFLIVNASLNFIELAKYLKSINRLYYIIKETEISNYDEIYKIFKEIEINDFFKNKNGINNVDVITQNTKLYSKKTIKAISIKALKNYISDKKNKVNGNNNLSIFIVENKVYIGLDCFGKSLHKRNYRLDGGISPLKENLAASLVINSLKFDHEYLIDPFCGSGTIITEAILFIYMKKNLGLFPIINLKNLDQELSDEILNKYICKDEDIEIDKERNNNIDKKKKNNKVNINLYNCKYFIGADIDGNAIENSKRNIERMLKIYFNNSYNFRKIENIFYIYKVCEINYNFYIILVNIDSYKLKEEIEKIELLRKIDKTNAVLISNLPYGKRLDKKFTNNNSLAAIQKVFKDFDCEKYFLSTMKFLPALLEKQPKKKRKLYNGKIEVTLFNF